MLNIKDIEFKRKSLQINQEDFAVKIGITRPTYQNSLKNQDFRLTHLIKISEVLEISFCELFEKEAIKGDFQNIKSIGNGKNNNVNIGTGLTPKGTEIQHQLEICISEKEGILKEVEGLKRENKLLTDMIEMLKK